MGELIIVGAGQEALGVSILMPEDPDKDTKYRLGQLLAWLIANQVRWYQVDLARYRDYMLQEREYAPATAGAHLATVRARYRAILRDNATRDLFFGLARLELERRGQEASPANLKAMVDELTIRLKNALDPQASTVKVKKSQDHADGEHLRLTAEQANALMAAPGNRTLQGLRDTAVIALMLCTGIREGELISLDVRDLRQELGGVLALHIREGKGCKERLVPYGALEWVLAIVDRWLQAAGIEKGPVFCGIFKGGHRLRPGRLTTRAIQCVLRGYPVMIGGQASRVRPHDLRRTYARRLYEAGFDLVSIQQNLGHANIQTTLGYIGALDADKRRPPAVYSFGWQEWLQEGLQPLPEPEYPVKGR
ncbi:MAG TPA: tyrosine-type recombinase/integrase [Anaerolineae bacterium]|nr:tyrosine-type recombinase/integrase [Anaerolineae bacterium]